MQLQLSAFLLCNFLYFNYALNRWELEQLNQKLSLIADVTDDGEHPEISFTVFVPDKFKAGGSYETITDTVKKVDSVYRKVVLMSTEGKGGMNKTIDFDKIIEIHGELVDYLDDAAWE